MRLLLFSLLSLIILSSFNPVLRDKKQTKKLAWEIYRSASLGESFEKLANKYSEDPGSNKKGGEYLNIKKGVFVKEIEKEVNNLKVNELSKPFITDYGYTLIKLKEKNEEQYSINYILLTYKK